jgi:hypothetical protein
MGGGREMKILIACEESQVVTEAFINAGHKAMSCDLEHPGAKGLPHYQGNVIDILYNDWDMIIAHPPCDFLANSGVRWLHEDKTRWIKMVRAANFFKAFIYHPCPKVCIENPIQHCYAREHIPKYQQIIQPWMFGHTTKKATCLWLKGLPKLRPTEIIAKELRTADVHLEPPGPNRKKNRSRFYEGIAKAMAEQWT